MSFEPVEPDSSTTGKLRCRVDRFPGESKLYSEHRRAYQQGRRWRLIVNRRSLAVSGGWAGRPVMNSAQILLYSLVLIGAGCDQTTVSTSTDEQDEAALQAHLDQILNTINSNTEPEKTPEEKRARIAELLPLAEETWKTGNYEETIPILKELVHLDPTHRRGCLMLAQAWQAEFLATETEKVYQSGVAIRSAGHLLDGLREKYNDFSEDELEIFREVYFQMCRDAGRLTDFYDEFHAALANLMSVGFTDVERLRTEPNLKKFRADPRTAPAIEAAIAYPGAGKRAVLQTEQKAKTPDPAANIPD